MGVRLQGDTEGPDTKIDRGLNTRRVAQYRYRAYKGRVARYGHYNSTYNAGYGAENKRRRRSRHQS